MPEGMGTFRNYVYNHFRHPLAFLGGDKDMNYVPEILIRHGLLHVNFQGPSDIKGVPGSFLLVL